MAVRGRDGLLSMYAVVFQVLYKLFVIHESCDCQDIYWRYHCILNTDQLFPLCCVVSVHAVVLLSVCVCMVILDDIANNINTIKSIVNPGLIQFTY
jgi:hypothetical protein